MMTQTHSLIAVALLASPERSSSQNLAILIGSIIPDAAIFGLFFWSKLNSIPESEVWQKIYFSEPMLTLTAIGNSLPLYVVLLCVVAVLWSRSESIASVQERVISIKRLKNKTGLKCLLNSSLALFSIAAITHLMGDFPVHVDDAHAHLWPISDWRFQSPISYWDADHHGRVFSLFEAALGCVLAVIVFRRFKHTRVRTLAGIAVLSYIAVPIYFSLKF